MKNTFWLLAILSLLVSCSSYNYIKVNPLRATPQEIMKGDSTTLSWNIEGIGDFRIRLVNYSTEEIIADNLPMQGAYKIAPETTTVIALYAKSKNWFSTVKGVTSVKVEVK